MKKKFFSLIPGICTALNLYCGLISIILSFHYEFSLAGLFLIYATLFDLLDGKLARYLKVNSPIGKEMDSFADFLSFAIAPALLILNMGYSFFQGQTSLLVFSTVIPFLYVLCGALRLTIFNLGTYYKNVKKTLPSNFIGLPSTFAGLAIAIFATYDSFSNGIFYHHYIDFSLHPFIMLISLLFLGIFMLLPVEYPRFLNVFFNFKSPTSTIVTIIVLIGIFTLSRIVLLITTIYMIFMPLIRSFYRNYFFKNKNLG
jgi:CDP-diacylglycerol--serine O-phosphatidyltransferase